MSKVDVMYESAHLLLWPVPADAMTSKSPSSASRSLVEAVLAFGFVIWRLPEDFGIKSTWALAANGEKQENKIKQN
jgi:hypothetical protein